MRIEMRQTDEQLLALLADLESDRAGQPGVTDYRNPHLAEALKVLGYVQRFGVGIATARKVLAENGNPPPEFNVSATHVLVTVRSSR